LNLAIFDFCETLVNFQTADRFCRFVLEKKSKKRIIKLDSFFSRFKVYGLFAKLGVKNLQKRILLSGFRGIEVSEMHHMALIFLKDIIEPRLNANVYALFKNHLANGDYVVINSGGYEPYLKIFAEQHLVKKLFATKLETKDDLCTGKIDGMDCLGIEKVIRMQNDGVLNQSYKDVFVYSDSITDRPIFNLGTKKYAVVSDNKVPLWATKDNFEIIKV
jgi:HAD superfamily hydrolase (TIGR01490 family)